MTEAGADVVVAHLGLTTGGAIGADTARTLDQSIDVVREWAAAARSVRQDVVVLCHGGPVSAPKDVAVVLAAVPEIDGFYGASSMERLPTEVAIADTVREFGAIER
ncbi:phosphoenolpyruvate hydrolase family protein [Isoptericola sp. b441]|uniref:Phosphoenolpyruvate hydrolase family protein n=1 Tax=Actinotalea lenta TaxID=3064654 RepID=A0ABT9DBR3_9CELL|nr:phosphoenolpyruvate hydrolase family protein [Isoptericola sp. b441]MDO8108319.1 phosphoenolpyruvate hydrolase family protein [Isoptericola sp. b441]